VDRSSSETGLSDGRLLLLAHHAMPAEAEDQIVGVWTAEFIHYWLPCLQRVLPQLPHGLGGWSPVHQLLGEWPLTGWSKLADQWCYCSAGYWHLLRTRR